MGDRLQCHVSAQPIVSVSNANTDPTDVILHDIKTTLGGSLSWDSANEVGTARWWYDGDLTANTTSSNLITGNYTDGIGISSNDDVRLVFIKHKGVDSSGAASAATDYLFIYLNGGGDASADAICLEPGDSIVLKFKLANGVNIGNLHMDMSANTAKLQVCAICDDGA